MKLAYFKGCKIPFYLKSYEKSFKAVMQTLGVELASLEFHCCGYPARSEDFETSIYHALRNLAVAEKERLDIITPCKCCFGQFKHAVYWYANTPDLKKRIDALLDKDGLKWHGRTKIWHLLDFLHNGYGREKIASCITTSLVGEKAVVQYGCHALRPFTITGFDHPYAPSIFETLLKITGIEVVAWSKSDECCGNPVYAFDKELSAAITRSKMQSATEIGADYICCACTHCQMQYEQIGLIGSGEASAVPVLFTHLLGRALGLNI